MSIRENTAVWEERTFEDKHVLEFPIAEVRDRNGDGEIDVALTYAAFEDITGDGVEDYIFLLGSAFDLEPRCLLAIDGHSLEQIRRFDLPSTGSHVFMDFDGDGSKELILLTSAPGNGVEAGGLDDSHCYCLFFDLQYKLLSSAVFGGEYSKGFLGGASDIDENGCLELIFAISNSNVDQPGENRIYIIDPISMRVTRSIRCPVLTSFTLGDVDNDGKPEILAGFMEGKMSVYNTQLRELLTIDFPGRIYVSRVALADLDRNGQPEILAYSKNHEMLVADNQGAILALQPLPGSAGTDALFIKVARRPGELESVIVNAQGPTEFYEVTMARNVASLAFDLVPFFLTAIFASILVYGVVLNRRMKKFERLAGLADQVMNIELGHAMLFIDAKMRLVRTSKGSDRFIELPEAAGFTEPAAGDDSPAATVNALLRRLAESPQSEIVFRDQRIRRGDKEMAVDVVGLKRTDSQGNLQGYIVLILNKSQEKLLGKAMEGVSAGQELFHKIKTLVSVFKNDLFQLRKRLAEGAEEEAAARILQRMESVSEDISAVAKGFLLLSRLDGQRLDRVSVGDLARRVTSRAERASTGSVEFKLEVDSDIPSLVADEAEIEAMIENLVENAVKAVGDGGSVVVRVERLRRLDAEGSLGERDFIVLTVQDDGCGIDPQFIGRIFEPGFSLFPEKVGLGMTIVKRIVDNHNGTISVESQPGRGTSVRVVLPCGE